MANPIQVAADGQQAIDYLRGVGKFADREQYPLPMLVLLDLKLPYVMGMEVLRWIRQQPGTPMVVVMLTASSEDEDIATAYRLGANGFLVKPSEASKMDDMVKAIRDFWLTHNTPPEGRYKERAAANSIPAGPARNSMPSTIGTHRAEWHPMLSKQTYEKASSLDL